MKKIFIRSKKMYWSEDAIIGGRFIREYSYAIGYWEAGDYLVEKAMQLPSSRKDRLFYPICFNYRHCVELILKELIILAEKFYKKSVSLGYEIKKLTAYRSDDPELHKTHSLEQLLNWLIAALECVSEEIFDPAIKSLLLELHYFDPDSERTRYRTNKKTGTSSFPTQQSYNLVQVKTEITRILDYLAGIDAWIDYYDGMANTMINELNPEH